MALIGVLFLLLGAGFISGMLANRGWHGDGRVGPQQRNPFALVGAAGLVVVVGSVATALTYRRINQRLARTEEQRRRFLADVTHELRTPLAVLQSGIEAQLDGIHPRDDAHVASLLEETQRLGHLVEDLHTLALADAGRLTLHRGRCEPQPLVEDAVADHAALAARKGVVIRSTFGAGLPSVDVDPTRFRQILDNLLSNAVRHTKPQGEVQVRVEADGGEVRITVTDAGPGFLPDRLDHLFERSTRPADSGSSGLGLSIVHDLVRAHGGTVWAANQPGGGAAVGFTVPVAATQRSSGSVAP